MASDSNLISVILHNGIRMPILGIGTTHNGGYNHEALVYALRDCGYRLIDTAKRYGTEAYVGQAIRDSGVPREEVFLTTKLWPSDYGFEKTLAAFEASIQRLGVDYLDLYLLHWPDCHGSVQDRKSCIAETWRALEHLLDQGKCRAIGVSNFLRHHLEDLLRTARVVPHVNQCEFHPYQNPKELRKFCSEKGIQFQGYCPLAKGQILSEPPVLNIAKRLGLTPAQVLIRWSIQCSVVTIPKTTKKHRVRENCQVISENCQLPAGDFELLNNLEFDSGYSKKIVDLSRMQTTINSDLPDGYKLVKTGGADNSFPAQLEYGSINRINKKSCTEYVKERNLHLTFANWSYKSLK